MILKLKKSGFFWRTVISGLQPKTSGNCISHRFINRFSCKRHLNKFWRNIQKLMYVCLYSFNQVSFLPVEIFSFWNISTTRMWLLIDNIRQSSCWKADPSKAGSLKIPDRTFWKDKAECVIHKVRRAPPPQSLGSISEQERWHQNLLRIERWLKVRWVETAR